MLLLVCLIFFKIFFFCRWWCFFILFKKKLYMWRSQHTSPGINTMHHLWLYIMWLNDLTIPLCCWNAHYLHHKPFYSISAPVMTRQVRRRYHLISLGSPQVAVQSSVKKKIKKPETYIECFFGLQSKWLKGKEIEMEVQRCSMEI